MNNPEVARTSLSSLAPSVEPVLEVYLLPCGHGDTILLRFPGDIWALVDCFLPKSNGAWQRFFDFVNEYRIQRLAWVVLTHPDFDHYHGMADVLEHFTTGGRSIGYWCDAGLQAADLRNLIQACQGIHREEYERLQQKLDELDEAGRLAFVEVNDRVQFGVPEGCAETVEVRPIGPSAARKRRAAREASARLQQNASATVEVNDLSIILCVSIRHADQVLTALLPGDAGPIEMDEAMDALGKQAGAGRNHWEHDFVKVSHHGSLESHARKLCSVIMPANGVRVAAVSAGTRRVLPDREVLQDYLRARWGVFITTKRSPSIRTDHPMALSNRGKLPITYSQHRLHVTLNPASRDPASRVVCRPDEARVAETELPCYGNAR